MISSFVIDRRACAALLVLLALAGCTSSSPGASPDSGTDGADAQGVPEAGVDCGYNGPACAAVQCAQGVTCNYATPGGACGACACPSYGGAGEWSCSGGVRGCPATMPAASSACPLQSGLPSGGASCFYPVDASCTVYCTCTGDPELADAGAWVCSNAPCGGEAGAADASGD